MDRNEHHLYAGGAALRRLVFGHDEAIAAWVADRIPHVGGLGFSGPCAAIGIASGDRLLAGIVYHDYQAAYGTIQLSMAAESPMWARRETIRALLHYPFRQLGVFKAWTATPHDNDAALRVNEHIGFKREGTLAHHFGRKRHCVVCRMFATDYTRLYGE